MTYDIPTVAAAMEHKIRQLDHISHNLANVQTPGFKAQHLYALQSLQAQEGDGSAPSSLVLATDFSQGTHQKTGNPLDLSLQGEGFFVVQTPAGEAFTRKGDFTINGQNRLSTQAGDPVLGESGPITLRNGKINVSREGAVYVNEEQVGKLRIADFTDRQALSPVGGGLYRDPGAAGMKKVDRPAVAAGHIEFSNVNAIREMVQMIDIHRSFETYQKVVQTLSEQDKLSTSRVGRVG
jgi:flagellar basal-body rod protein FlgF